MIKFSDKLRIAFWVWLVVLSITSCCKHVRTVQVTETEMLLVPHACPEGWNIWEKSDDKPSPEWVWCYRVRPTAERSRASARPSV